MKSTLLLIVFAVGAQAQLISGGGGSGGTSTPPTASTCAGPGTSCVVDVSSMGISSLTKVLYACKSSAGADVPVVSTSTVGSPNLTSVTLNWTGSLSSITCTVQAGGSPGANGSNGLSTAAYAVTFTNETTKTVSAATLTAAGITLPTHVSPSGIVDYSDDGFHNITLTAGIPITATVYIEGGGAYVDADATLAANSDSRVASQKATKGYVDAQQVTINVKQAGAVGDGSTDDTAAIQAAITAAIAIPNAVLEFPASSSCYKSGVLNIAGSSGFTVRGAGGKICWFGVGTGEHSNPTPSLFIGLELSGTNANLTIRDMVFVGDGICAKDNSVCDYHAGVWVQNDAVVTNLKLLHNYAQNIVLGFECASGKGSTLSGCVVDGNVVDHAVGGSAIAGQGYAFHLGTGSATGVGMIRSSNNIVYHGQRHDYYFSDGTDASSVNDQSYFHRDQCGSIGSLTDCDTGGRLPAFVVARSRGITVANALVETAQDGCVSLTPDVSANQSLQQILLTGMRCLNYVNPASIGALTIGAGTPSANQTTQDIQVVNNAFTATADGRLLDLNSCINCTFDGNTFTRVGSPSTTYGLVSINTFGETDGTATYSQHLLFTNNHGYATGGGAVRLFTVSSLAGASGIVMRFQGNQAVLSGSMFSVSGTLANPNISQLDGNVTGWPTTAPTITGTVLQRAPVGSTIAGDVVCAVAADTTINSSTVTGGSSTASTITVNMASTSGFVVGQNVGVTGAAPSGFNTTGPIAAIVSNTSVTFASANDPGAWSSGGNAYIPCGNASTDAVTSYYSFANSVTVPANTLGLGSAAQFKAITRVWTPSTSTANQIGAFWGGSAGQTNPGGQQIYTSGSATISASRTGGSNLMALDMVGLAAPSSSSAYSVAARTGLSNWNYGNDSNSTPTVTLATSTSRTFVFAVKWSSTGVASGTYTSGITATGATNSTCVLGSFNNSSTATATVALTGTNTIAGGTPLVITARGAAATAAPTTATASNGTAVCSGTATIATVLGGSPGNAIQIVAMWPTY